MQRVAAYCRVSTDKEDQIHSLDSQQKYFADYIERHPAWVLSEIYVDEGITGTSTKKRHAFNQMIADAQNRQFDLIITKEISRFARNTLDSIYYTRKLKALGIGVIFMNDNIHTLDPDAELRLTIMSSIAQEESRKTSDRVKWGQKRRMEQGVVFGRDMLGYDVRNGKLYINEAGAEVVQLIFHKFVNEDKGTHVIARELREAGIQTATYMKKWSNTAILRILRNEKYCGDLIQKKTYTPSYLTHEKKYNHGQEELIILRNHHEPIISRDLFDRTQRELARRAPSGEQKAKHSNRHCFSGKIKCDICGCTYVSRSKKRKDGSTYKSWRCLEASRHGRHRIDTAGNEIGCDSPSVNEEDLKRVMRQVIKNLRIEKEPVISHVSRLLRSIWKSSENDRSLTKIQARIDSLQQKKSSLIELYMSHAISKADFRQMHAKYEEEIASVKRMHDDSERDRMACRAAHPDRHMVEGVIRDLIYGDTWDEAFHRHVLERIIIRPGNILDIYLSNLSEPKRYRIVDPMIDEAEYSTV